MSMMQTLRARFTLAAALASLTAAGCARIPLIHSASPAPRAPVQAAPVDTLELIKARTREAVPLRPTGIVPISTKASVIYREAIKKRGLRILISTQEKALWLMKGSDVVMRAPVAIGMPTDFVYKGRK